jgi:V8-like Glu-specific endopeptidase
LRRARILPIAAAGLATLFLVPALAMPSASGQPAANVPAAGVPMSVEAALGNLGQAYPSAFGGLAVINNGTQIAVYLTTPTAAIKGAFQAVAPAGSVVFRSTPRSARALAALTQTLENQWSTLRAHGINLVDFGPNILIGKVDIGIENLTDAQRKFMNGRFGAGALNIYNVTPAEVAARHADTTRIDDTAPYNGGDAIEHETSTTKSGCTSGFGIRISGNARLVTAGHCFNVGWNVINERCTSFTDCSGSRAAMGDVTQNGLGDNRCNCNGQDLDSLVFTGCNGHGTCGGSDLIFTGDLGNPQIAVVSGKGSWNVGDQVCVSGAYGGEKCGFQVQSVDHCYNIGSYYLCHITQTYQPNANTVDGDSGAPVFRFSGSLLEMVGTHTGIGGAHIQYFTGINRILDKWNACLITGSSGCVT